MKNSLEDVPDKKTEEDDDFQKAIKLSLQEIGMNFNETEECHSNANYNEEVSNNNIPEVFSPLGDMEHIHTYFRAPEANSVRKIN